MTNIYNQLIIKPIIQTTLINLNNAIAKMYNLILENISVNYKLHCEFCIISKYNNKAINLNST